MESKLPDPNTGTAHLEIWTVWNFGLTSILFPHVNYKQVLSSTSVSRNTDNNHHNCYLTTNYEAGWLVTMWKQSRCWYCLSVATLTVFTAIAPSLAKIYRVTLVIWLTLSWHSPLHKHPVATPALDIISITPKGRNKTTVITIQHRPFLQRGGPSVGDGLMRAEILQTFLYSSLTCGARTRYRCVLGSFEALCH